MNPLLLAEEVLENSSELCPIGNRKEKQYTVLNVPTHPIWVTIKKRPPALMILVVDHPLMYVKRGWIFCVTKAVKNITIFRYSISSFKTFITLLESSCCLLIRNSNLFFLHFEYGLHQPFQYFSRLEIFGKCYAIIND